MFHLFQEGVGTNKEGLDLCYLECESLLYEERETGTWYAHVQIFGTT